MRDEKRAARAEEIETAAYGVLEAKGYDGLTMLAVARAAKASNETLYRWYGDKQGLIEALIRRNTERVHEVLGSCEGQTVQDTLRQVGPVLLGMLLGSRAIALNRAAAADGTGALGALLAEAGRGTVAPWICSVLQDGLDQGILGGAGADRMAEVYLGLLIGDAQIRRVTGAMPEPAGEVVKARAGDALTLFFRLYGVAQLDVGRAGA